MLGILFLMLELTLDSLCVQWKAEREGVFAFLLLNI